MKPHRRCKIVATIGPASNPLQLLQAGTTAFRVNFSHGEYATHRQRIESIRAAEQSLSVHVPIIADLQGPKIRVGKFEQGKISLRYGEEVTLEVSAEPGREGLIRLPHPEVLAALQSGDILKLDDGSITLSIVEKAGHTAKARVEVPGVLSDCKGVNLPYRALPIPALTEKDKADLEFALACGVDVIALSFVQTPQDILDAQQLIAGRAKILAKIEKPLALEQIEPIATLADMIMVARGDLGVELAMEQVPIAQRKIVQTCRRLGKPVIVATQMLQSMVETPVPTRAEASDVATAVYMGADAVMLSAESAVGKHPATAVAMMDRLICAVEEDEHFWNLMQGGRKKPQAQPTPAIAAAARELAKNLKAKAVFAFTHSGGSARAIAKERPRCPIYGLTPSAATARSLALTWGVAPMISPDLPDSDALFSWAEKWGKERLELQPGDQTVVLAGTPVGVAGNTNMLKVIVS